MQLQGTRSFVGVVFLSFHLLTTSAQMTSLAMRPHGVSEEYLLLRYLLTNYSKVARPVARSNEAVLVLARLFPIKLLNMYEKNEVLEMTMRLQLTWRDRMLVWHAPDFNNQSTVVIPGGQLWIPDLQIVNSVSDLYALLRDQKFDFKVHNDGSVWWHPTGNLVTRCELHLMYFPFDYQRCPIMLESAIYSHTQLNLTVRTDRTPVSLSMYAESGHWDLLKVTGQPRVLWVTNSTAFTRVEFWLYLGRKTTYFKMNIIFPCCMLSGLQMLTFFFPLESTERVPEATSILLSVIVFQTMIVDQLPRSSNSIPLLCIYVDMLTGISVLAVAEAVIVASLVSRKGTRTKAPHWLHGFLRFIYKWNSDTKNLGTNLGHNRSRSSLAFLRNSLAFQTFFGTNNDSSGRRKKATTGRNRLFSNPPRDIVLDNINTSNLGATTTAAGNNNSNDNSPYPPHRKSSAPVSSYVSASNTRTNVQAVPSAPVTILPANGMLTSGGVKFLPYSGVLDLIGEDGFDDNDSLNKNVTKTRRRAQMQLQQPSQQMPFVDAPLADFDPDSSIMMTSSMFGSAYQSSGVQSCAALPPALLAPLPLTGSTVNCSSNNSNAGDADTIGDATLTAFQSPPPELFVDDTNSLDSWQISTIAVSKAINQQPDSLSNTSCPKQPSMTPPQPAPLNLQQQRPTTKISNKSNAELSPLLPPRKVPEREFNIVSTKKVPSPSPNTAYHQQAISAVIAATSATAASSGGFGTPREQRAPSYASTAGRADSQGDLSPTLPLGLPRQSCMRRSRASLFIPAMDSDDLILDWIYLARVLDAVMFLICLTVVIVVPVVLFGILPPTTVD